ncbi:MAG: ABC transporter permease [Myxococcaceae bacterium]
MRAFLARRLLMMVPTFLGITLLTFGVAHLAPGDPLMLDPEGTRGGAASKEALEHFRHSQGLDLPLYQQYGRWVGRVVTLDFGASNQDHRKVMEKIGEALPRTLLLSGLALFLSYLLAIPLGVFSAVKQGAPVERGVTVVLFLLYSMPSFWVAVMLLLTFSSPHVLDWFPLQGLTSDGYGAMGPFGKLRDLLWHAVLPLTCLTYGALASISRYMRSGMLEVIRQDYIRTARAKGLSERVVIWKHALRNAIIPTVTLLGVMLPHVLGGSVIVESIFGIHGMGLLAFEAILHRDYPMVMGITTLVAVLTMFSVLLSDVLHALADPRVAAGAAR